MSIWGIIIGGTAGFALGGPTGGLLGAVAGHAVESKFNPSRPDPQATKRIAFTVAVIALSAKMAKADGVVTRDEIAAFRARGALCSSFGCGGCLCAAMLAVRA